MVKPDSEHFQVILFYSKVTFALNAARILKAMELFSERDLNATEEYLIRFAHNEMLLNTSHIVDKNRSAINLHRLIDLLPNIDQEERMRLQKAADRIYSEYQEVIADVNAWRNNLVAHTSKGIDSVEKLIKYKGEISIIQKMNDEIKLLLESISWFKTEYVVKTLDYEVIVRDLRLGRN